MNTRTISTVLFAGTLLLPVAAFAAAPVEITSKPPPPLPSGAIKGVMATTLASSTGVASPATTTASALPGQGIAPVVWYGVGVVVVLAVIGFALMLKRGATGS